MGWVREHRLILASREEDIHLSTIDRVTDSQEDRAGPAKVRRGVEIRPGNQKVGGPDRESRQLKFHADARCSDLGRLDKDEEETLVDDPQCQQEEGAREALQ